MVEVEESEKNSFFMFSNAGMTDYMSPAFLMLRAGRERINSDLGRVKGLHTAHLSRMTAQKRK